MTAQFADLRDASLDDVRAAIRSGSYAAHTAGLGDGYLQANIVILPEAYALDFLRFCQRNPKPCPVTGVSDTGNPMMTTLGREIDIRSDVPAYNIYREGVLAGSAADIADIWTDDMVAFAIGCSFTFEHALIRRGIPVRHIERNLTVPMYRSTLQTVPAGPFGGAMAVSMRAIPHDRVAEAAEISSRYPLAHGGPVHIGDPAAIGIADIDTPDWGDAIPVPDGNVTVFWACGVTPQIAVERARLPLVITHKPGHMLITDVPEDAETPILQAS